MKTLKNINVVIILVILIALIACGSIKQNKSKSYYSFKNFNNDTLKYMKSNFYEKKDIYIKDNLRVLLNELEIPVKSYVTILNINDLTGIYLSFYEPKINSNKISKKQRPHNIIVEFEKPIPFDLIKDMLRKNKGNWTKDEEEFFGKQIIKDIDLMQYDK